MKAARRLWTMCAPRVSCARCICTAFYIAAPSCHTYSLAFALHAPALRRCSILLVPWVMFTDSRSLEIGAAALASAAALVFYRYSDDIAAAKSVMTDSKYQAGEDYGDEKYKAKNFFADPVAISRALVKDYASVRSKYRPSQLVPLIEDLLKKGEPLDDKKGTTEELISILTTLPAGSETRVKLTNKLIDTLWDNLQHPPLSYVGGDVNYSVVSPSAPSKSADASSPAGEPDTANSIKFTAPDGSCTLRESVPVPPNGLYQYRQPDGGFNNILNPDLGRAGTPYAKTIHTSKRLHGVKPDAGLLFDMLMARGTGKNGEKDTFVENPAGISSILFYHASIIIHDIFRTNGTNRNISDTSSYLDLAPLYGSSLADQLEIRTMKEGKLKPDTFHEKRLLGQPPGVNVLLVLYNRFHNYVADILLKINENSRFTLAVTENPTPEEMAKAVAKQDHDLFNVARLIVGGMYINICLHDYLRAITNTHHSDSSWTLDPRVDIDKHFDGEGVPRGIGNQVSVEFNLLYRFHSCISKRDEKWTNDFFCELLPGRTPDTLDQVTPEELMISLQIYSKKLPEPSQREFGGLKRGKDGRFNDEDLVKVLKESIEDPAGCFGARMVPKALRVVEVLGILQARRWQVASLNEFRQFFGLKRHETFKDINKDDDIAALLEKLYTHPDMVELYPGLMIEDIKPAKATGCGICPTYSVGRAVLSDAVTLVRSDRFNTIDYTVSNLTSWGYNEVQQDYKTLGGSMFYKLIQRGVPGWFPYNSLHSTQPMFTKNMNAQIAREIGTIAQYTNDDPKRPRSTVVLTRHADVTQVLENSNVFVVPWLPAVNNLFLGDKNYPKRTFEWFMLAGDKPENAASKKLVQKLFKGIPDLGGTVSRFIAEKGAELLKKEEFKMKEDLFHIDIIRDVAIPLNARLLADLFYMDMASDENPRGSLSASEFYKNLLAIRVWGVNNNDPAMALNRRRWAQESAKIITDTTRTLVNEVAGFGRTGIMSSLASLFQAPARTNNLKSSSLRSCGRKLVEGFLAEGISPEQTADYLWLTSFGGIGVPVAAFCEILQFFLQPANVAHWERVQQLAKLGTDEPLLRKYVLEAQRLTTSQRNVRIATQATYLGDKKVEAGAAVVLMLGHAARDVSQVDDADQFNPLRRASDLITPFSVGMHSCVGYEIAVAYLVGMVKLAAGLKELRPAPGLMGKVKSITVGTEKCYLNDSWSYLAFDPSTWKVHYSGHGVGVWHGGNEREGYHDLAQIEFELRKRKRAAEDAKANAAQVNGAGGANGVKSSKVDFKSTAKIC
ncbi:hypothetical protein FH972_022412 [Carpinus fangiana]|uniref:linoleate 8R-lipoxygenase n=1 Tax=Carpinus fangiana TaxID=176857 RepID=A0A5N6KS64_9ROSI|nr:hypothetical protein FH972_022412 [Carpinus fangiana]